ncbi:MAG: DNA repair protein RadA, partial [Xanthomonadales bacterium]|nr:DNA repair protein RadA [Xanthomonadales bacterium]
MAKDRIVYLCAECGAEHPKWAGQCGECGAWNSLTEQRAVPLGKGARGGGFAGTRSAAVENLST